MNDERNLTANWSKPTKQNVIDLYTTRMELMTCLLLQSIRNGEKMNTLALDDIRSALCAYTGLSVQRYDKLVDKAITYLNKDGIPELFLVTETYEEDFGPLSQEDMIFAYGEASQMYTEYIEETKEIQEQFNQIVDPQTKAK